MLSRVASTNRAHFRERYVPPALESLLTARVRSGRLATSTNDAGGVMPDLSYDQLQARALDSIQQAWEAADAGRNDVAARLTTRAQVQALLSIGAALQELAEAVRESRQA